MRRIFAILAVVALIGATTSCKKDYTCTCVTEVVGIDAVTTTTSLGKLTKGDAEDKCAESESDVAGVTTTCEI